MVRGWVHCRVLLPLFLGSSCGRTIRKVTGGVGRPVHDHECSLIHNQLQELSVNKIREFLVWNFVLFRAQPGLLDFVMNILRTVFD